MDYVKKYGHYVTVLLGLIAIVLLFVAPALKTVVIGTTTNLVADINAFQTIFGHENPNFDFNVLGFVAVLFLVAGLVIRFIPINEKHQFIISAFLLLLAGIFLFVYPLTITATPGLESSLGLPLILAGILTIIGAVLDGAVSFLKMKDA